MLSYTIAYMETVSARVPEDVAEQIEGYADERDISKSEAVRRLIEAGLSEDETQERLSRLERRMDRLEQPWWWRWF